MRKFIPGEYSAGRGTPARKHTGDSKELSPGEKARVARITAMRTGQADPGGLGDPKGLADEAAMKDADLLTNNYASEMEDFGEEV